MLAYMKRTTVKLPDDIDMRVRHEAERRGLTVSEWTREAIEAHLPGEGRRQFLAAGAGHSGQDDISERIHEILDREWARSRREGS
jgi:predicted DNA-binding protein